MQFRKVHAFIEVWLILPTESDGALSFIFMLCIEQINKWLIGLLNENKK